MKKTFLKIMPLGLAENDLQVVKSLCSISATRSRAYMICLPGEPADFYLVDGDKPDSMARSEAARAIHPAPAIALASRNAVAGTHSILRRPVVASRILAAFDELAVKLGHTPQLNIGEGETLPADQASELANSPLVAPRPPGTPAARLGLALVVDDSPTVRKQLELSLQSLGVDVDAAEDGDFALQKIGARRYDIVFLDVVLPGADGYQICKTIKKNRATKDTPVIMLTGKGSPFDRIRGSLAGCDTYLTKPVDSETFRSVVEKFLGDRVKGPVAGTVAHEAAALKT